MFLDKNGHISWRKVSYMCFAVIFIVGVMSTIVVACLCGSLESDIMQAKMEVAKLNGRSENLHLAIDQYRDENRVLYRAGQIGMVEPSESQVRYLNLSGLI